MKIFGKLLNDSGLVDLDLNGVEISDYEVDIRAQVFMNGWQEAEKVHKKLLNNISFQLNKKLAGGCQGEELIRSYNERIGGFLDDFIF